MDIQKYFSDVHMDMHSASVLAAKRARINVYM